MPENIKKTILFILPDLESGGAERVVTTLANHLPRAQFTPKIMLLRKEGIYLQWLKEDVEVIDLQVKRIRHALRPIFKEIKKRQPDIVFSGFGEVNAYIASMIRLFPRVKFIARETNVVSQHVKRREIRFFYKFYNNFHKIICQSEDMQRDLINNFNINPAKIVKINNPVDFHHIDNQLECVDKPKVFTSGYRHVVAIGNLSARKGFDNLLKVFIHLQKESIMLHILGDGPEGEQLHQMRNDLNLDLVAFHGRQENPYKFLKYADLFVLSSRYEGFPNVLLEAGACGCYALANDCPGGIREIILPGVNGEIGCIEEAENFATQIKRLVDKNHDKVAIKKAILSRFSKEIILEKYIQELGM